MLIGFSASAQTTSGPATRRPDPIQGELQRRFEAEALEKVLSRRVQPTTTHERRALLDQIRKDFLQIQIIDDQLKKQRAADDPDLKAVSGYVSDIRHRSERLKDNLALPKSNAASASSSPPETKEYLKLRLDQLSTSINAFVVNPIFESAKILNPALSIQASNDLEQIIALSQEIKRATERLRRSAKQ